MAQSQQDPTAFYQSVLDELGTVPGVGIVVVNREGPVYTKGFGYGDLEKKSPFNGATNFYIASSTKSFTALIAAIADQKGIVKLDDPITKYLPEVKFDPALAAGQVKVRDLLSHTSGMENDPVSFRVAYSGEHSPEKLIQLLDYTVANKAGRGNYQYTNFGYNLYAIILDKVSGKRWQDWLQDEIFQPLGMKRTTAYMSKAEKGKWQMAKPYRGIAKGDIREVYMTKKDNSMQSAGGLITTLDDAARWLEMQLNLGKLDGKQVLPKNLVENNQQSVVKTGENRDFFNPAEYGYGWSFSDFGGQKVLHHFGGFPGYMTHISFMPEKGIGVAVFVNEAVAGYRLMNLFAAYAYDWQLNTPGREEKYEKMKGELAGIIQQASERITADLANRAKREWRLDVPFSACNGTFSNDLFGTVTLKGSADKIEVSMGNLWCVATPYTQPNTLRVELIPGAGEVVQLVFGENKELTSIRYSDRVFEKVKG